MRRNKKEIEFKDVLEESKYKDVSIKLSDLAQAQRKLLEEITKPLSLMAKAESLKNIESLIRKLDSINYFKDLIEPNLINSPLIELARQANKAISNLSITPYLNSILSQTIKLPRIWQEQVSIINRMSLNPQIESVLLGIQSQLTRSSEVSLLAERILLHINSGNFASLILCSSETMSIVQSHNLAFSESYTSLFKSLADKELSFLSLIPEVTILPPIEFFYNSRLLEAISIQRKPDDTEITLERDLSKDITDDLLKLLDLIDPKLKNLWNGAKEVIKSRGSDAPRHLSISLRELLTHVIHKLSPDENIRKWSTLPEHYHKDRPTRKARLLYIYRSVSFGPFSNFVEKDIEALLSLFDLFQEGTHSVTPPFSDEQLAMLLARTESALRFLIKSWFVSHHN